MVLIFYITGATKGIGKSMVEKVLARGDKVAATSRDKKQLNDLFGKDSDKFLALSVALADEESVKKSIDVAVKHFGTLDVVINNAGYSQDGPVEETTDQQVRDNMDINLFGAWNVIRHSVPILREKRSGVILNISSVAGTIGYSGFGSYCATKFALDGMTECLAMELKPFNIKVATINPGTDFLANQKKKVAKSADYQSVYDFLDMHIQINGTQRGDPNKLVDVIFQVINHKGDIPNHLYIGPDANEMVENSLNAKLKDLKAWKDITTKTDIDGYVDKKNQ
ncbi:Oxidoreductase [Cavenderia fasciculata]|uniref:Oxidoreductase n=1 Tax=Cavenderia fasciculata TaxID=261658 RepID=F4Q5W4_CACFS|nr:Oxidoreductase [Cavenderia fasciculata]EGG17373.1 Oxidoreductase [Cavenderia fasciculata]|eukprot:XP_004355857.1 Oxidoreductase [Cavenderia fasciculata]